MPQLNKLDYECTCGTCKACLGEKFRKSIYKAPKLVREEFFQKKISEEAAAMARGFMKIECPRCHQFRLVDGAGLKYGFSCDKCGYKTT